MAKRGQNEGSIYRRSDGRWTAVVSLGRERRQQFYGRTRRDVQEKLTAALRNRQQGLPVAVSKQRLGAYLVDWLAATKPNVRPRTYVAYELNVRRHITPELGNVPLERLTPQHVETLVSRKLEEGLSSQSVIHIRGILRRALQRAVKHELVVRNVAALADPPSLTRTREIRPLEPAEAQAFLEAVRGDRLEALYVLALTTGLRQGELLALQWADIDLERAEFRVNRALQRFAGQLQLVEPKTARSRRTGSLTASAITALQAHRARQVNLGLAPLPTAFVFTSGAGTPLEPRNVTRGFKRLLRRAGLPDIRFHDLRHSFATLLLVQGVSPRVVMEMLGHSQITLTMNTYSHVIPALKEDAAARLEAILGGRK